jgi:hypothetical protein
MSMQQEMYRNSLAELERLKTEYRDKLEENAELKASVAVAENEDKGDLLTSMASAFMGSASAARKRESGFTPLFCCALFLAAKEEYRKA